MSVALPCTAFSYVAAALIGHYGFAEPLGAMHLGALGLICAGVVMLRAGLSQYAADQPRVRLRTVGAGRRQLPPSACANAPYTRIAGANAPIA